MAKLYAVTFNDFGYDYVVADSFDIAGEIVVKFYGKDTSIKKVELLAETSKKPNAKILIHLTTLKAK